jgi:regulator of protease activity HflC (stomatin/prohibitin superfamily)
MFKQCRVSVNRVASASVSKTAARGFFKIVHPEMRGYRTLFGQNPTEVKPGIRLNIPIIHHMRLCDMREGLIPIHSLNAYTKDNVPVTISGALFYQIVDANKAIFSVQDVLSSTESLGMSAARSVIGRFEYDEINGDRNQINKALTEAVHVSCNPWGVVCGRFEIQDFKPQNEHVKRQLELQMEEERKRRANELNTQAIIRTAEGAKSAAVLKSEGELIAARNSAEARYIELVKIADGHKYQLEQEASAKALLVTAIMKAVDPENKSSADVTARLVTDYLMEMNRIDNLRAIANGPNNNSYVLPADLGGMFMAAKRLLDITPGQPLFT